MLPRAQKVEHTLYIKLLPMCKFLPRDSDCILINVDLAGPQKYKLIRCLRIMILINCFLLIAFANIGFYFDTNKHAPRILVPWQVLLTFKILVAVAGGFQLISISFLIIWRVLLLRKLLERRREEREMIDRSRRPWMDLESGRNPTSSDLFGHI